MGASVGRLRPSNGFIWFHWISVFGIAQRAVFDYTHRRFSMGIATLERSQAPARQGHFVVTAELPEIQTVTVWTPCCVFVDTILLKKITCEKWLYPVPADEFLMHWRTCFVCSMQSYYEFPGGGAIRNIYRDIHVQPCAISGQKCLVGAGNYALLCTVNDRKRPLIRGKYPEPIDARILF